MSKKLAVNVVVPVFRVVLWHVSVAGTFKLEVLNDWDLKQAQKGRRSLEDFSISGAEQMDVGRCNPCVPSPFFRAPLCKNIVSHDRKDVVDGLTAVIHVVHPLNPLALDETNQTHMLLALSTVAGTSGFHDWRLEHL